MPNQPLYSRILQVAKQLENDLIHLDFESLPVHDSVKSYYRFDLTKIRYVSECNAFILYQLVSGKQNDSKKILVIDHGAGLGFFSFLVKRMNYQCICHDISDEYIEGIKIIGEKLQAIPDHFVTGDTDELINYCRKNNLYPGGLGSRNVIEHIPDYKVFFGDLKLLSSSGFVAVICTSANIHNPAVKKIHINIHQQYETIGSNTDMDNPILNTKNCGMKIRTELIRSHFPNLDEDIIEELAKRCRGFVEQDIVKRVAEYIRTNTLPDYFPEESNTRDPYTGAWVERLVPYRSYKEAAELNSFDFRLLSGFYNTHYNSKLKNSVAYILNLFLSFKHPWTANISPFLAMKLIKK